MVCGQGTDAKKKYRKDKPWDHEGIDHWKPVMLDGTQNSDLLLQF